MGQKTWTMKHVMGSYCWDLQREVSMTPLMRVEGYRADGGDGDAHVDVVQSSSFIGAVLSEASLFEGKLSELCRDLGGRGSTSADTHGSADL